MTWVLGAMVLVLCVLILFSVARKVITFWIKLLALVIVMYLIWTVIKGGF